MLFISQKEKKSSLIYLVAFLKSNIDSNKENIESKISPNSDDITTNIPSKQLKEDGLTTSENKRIPVPEHVEPQPKKRGFLSRFFLPYG